MKNMLPILPCGAALTLALLLSACGKQEAVGDVPSSEELAQQADAASQAIRDEAAAAEGDGAKAAVDLASMESYANALRGFTIMVPAGWTVDTAASDDNGRVFTETTSGTKLAVSWVENREDAAWSKAVEAVEDGNETMEGGAVGKNEYRASGILTNGLKSSQRLLRKPDGTMVQAEITYAADQAKSTDPLASAILDSLTLQ
ncbi:Lipoprotein [Parasphingorhabdus sp. NYA22]